MFESGWKSRLFARPGAAGAASGACVGVQIGKDHVAAVRLREGASLPVFEAARRLQWDGAGTTATVRTLSQEGIFAGARVVLSLPAGKYDVVSVPSPPSVPEEELRDALRWQMRNVLPYSPDEAAFDFVRLPQAEGAAPGGAPAILVVAAQRREVAQSVAPFYAAGIEIDAVDIPEMIQRNLLAGGGDHVCRAFLSFDDDSSLLTVQLGDELCFSRRMQLPAVQMEEEPEHVADRIATNVQRSLEVFARQSNLPEVVRIVVGVHPHATLVARAIAEQADIAATLFEPTGLVEGIADRAGEGAFAGAESVLALGAALRREGGSDASRRASPLAAFLARFRKAA